MTPADPPSGRVQVGAARARVPERAPGVPVQCARGACYRPVAFAVELVLLDALGRHLPLALPVGVCAPCALEVKLEGPGPLLAGLDAGAKRLAERAMARRGYDRPQWEHTRLNLIPTVAGPIVVSG